MSSTLATLTTQTRDGDHYVVITDDSGIEHTFLSVIPAIDLIEQCDIASASIRMTDADTNLVHARVWNTVLDEIKDWEILDPEDEAPVNHDKITSFTIHTSEWDNGYFPNGRITAYCGDAELFIPAFDPPRGLMLDEDSIACLNDGDLAAELKELRRGDYEHGANWSLTITKPDPKV